MSLTSIFYQPSTKTVTWSYDQENVAWQRIRVFSSAQYSAGGFNPASSTATYDSGQVPHPTTFPVTGGGLPIPGALPTGTYRVYAGYDQEPIPTPGYHQFTIDDTPPQPTGLEPVNGSTINTSTPAFSAFIYSPPTGTRVRMWVEISSSASMVPIVATAQNYPGGVYVSPGPSGLRVSGIMSGVHRLAQGTWYIRARAQSEAGTYGPYTGVNAFTISHLPSAASLSPTGGTSIPWNSGSITLDWTFSDPSGSDYQTAYEVEVERNSDGLVILDTGKVTSTTSQHGPFTIPGGTTYRDVMLRWRVRLWDRDDVVGNWSDYQLFSPAQTPEIIFVYPIQDETINTPNPTVDWTPSLAAGRTQYSWRVRVWDATDALIFDLGTVSTATSVSLGSNRLLNESTYTLGITIIDNTGLSGYDEITFNTSWDPPPTPASVIANSLYTTDGFVSVTWAGSTGATDFQAWRLYRSIANANEWEPIAEIRNESIKSFQDWLAPTNAIYDYGLAQIATVFEAPIESLMVVDQDVTVTDDRYWLIHPYESALNVALHVIGESFTDETEREILLVKGRGRKVNYGTRWGKVGSLTASIRDFAGQPIAREIRLMVEQMIDERELLYIRNPFGDIMQVAPGDITFDRMSGVGTREFGEMTIPYTELSRDFDATVILT